MENQSNLMKKAKASKPHLFDTGDESTGPSEKQQ
jgi:hypothetical protein